MKPHPKPVFPRPPEAIPKKEALLEALPEAKRWDPLPGSEGHQTPEPPSEDEDEEGRSVAEQLVDDGVERAEQEQADEAKRAAKQRPHSV
jgi:hypothetical protein